MAPLGGRMLRGIRKLLFVDSLAHAPVHSYGTTGLSFDRQVTLTHDALTGVQDNVKTSRALLSNVRRTPQKQLLAQRRAPH